MEILNDKFDTKLKTLTKENVWLQNQLVRIQSSIDEAVVEAEEVTLFEITTIKTLSATKLKFGLQNWGGTTFSR